MGLRERVACPSNTGRRVADVTPDNIDRAAAGTVGALMPDSETFAFPPRKVSSLATIFSVVGQHRDDPDRLLLLGEDGRHYQYDLPRDATTPVDPTDGWLVDPDAPAREDVAG